MGVKIVKVFIILAIASFVGALIYKAINPNNYEHPVTRLFKTIENLY